MEMERLLVKQFALEQQEFYRTTSLIHTSSSHRTAAKKQRPRQAVDCVLLVASYFLC